jgi:hypothetical protein
MKTSELTGHALNWAVARCEGGVGKNQLIGTWYAPSTNWAQGGPIIEREFITIINAAGDDVWSAYPIADDPVAHRKSGPTPLIAAMRCYVASKLGDEVEIPTELTQGETK